MTDRDAVANYERKVGPFDVKDTVVLDVRFFADLNVMHVATNRDQGPDTGTFSDTDVADHLCAGVDVAGRGDLRHDAAICPDHCVISNFSMGMGRG